MQLTTPRTSVGIVLVNKDKKVFVGQRYFKGKQTDDFWQMPQGGIETGEELAEAAKRELMEETGINKDNVEIIAVSKNWYTYEIPEDLVKHRHFSAQTQKWFLMMYNGDDEQINLDQEKPEFSSWKWEEYKKVPKDVIDFKKDVYKQVFKDFSWYFDES